MPFRIMTPSSQRKPQMTIHSHPSLSTYGSNPTPYTTDDLATAKCETHSKYLHWLRIVITTLTLGVSIAVAACAGVSLQAYSQSHLEPQWLLPLWPLDVDLRPTYAVLACGILITIFSLSYLIIAFAPMPRKLHNLNIASTLLSFLSFVIALFTTIFSSTITNNFASSTSSGSLNSWTCKWQGFQSSAPVDFSKICSRGTAALDMVVLLVIMEALALVTTAAGWWVERRFKSSLVRVGKSEIELV